MSVRLPIVQHHSIVRWLLCLISRFVKDESVLLCMYEEVQSLALSLIFLSYWLIYVGIITDWTDYLSILKRIFCEFQESENFICLTAVVHRLRWR